MLSPWWLQPEIVARTLEVEAVPSPKAMRWVARCHHSVEVVEDVEDAVGVPAHLVWDVGQRQEGAVDAEDAVAAAVANAAGVAGADQVVVVGDDVDQQAAVALVGVGVCAGDLVQDEDWPPQFAEGSDVSDGLVAHSVCGADDVDVGR